MSIFNQNHKKGISLITVLLFMLVATIASTGVFKWLSSQNKDSASRLMQSEVYQASQAGIETARSWMVYHGHDVGALIKQYNDNKRKPINLDPVLKPLASDKNQSFSVHLIGVDTKSNPYKLKLVSTGSSRNGSEYSQVAILSVDGLYRVTVPQEQNNIDFDKAFFGAVNNFTGGDTIQSAIINGDFEGNIPNVKEGLLVTGDVDLDGSTSPAGSHLYVKGNFSNNGPITIGNSSSDTSVVYIGGDVTSCDGGDFTIHGDAYFNGNINKNCKIDIKGNATINGTLSRSNDADYFKVGKNLIFTPNGKLNMDGAKPFSAEKNVITPAAFTSTNVNTTVFEWGKENSSEVWKNSVATYSIDAVSGGSYQRYAIHNGDTTKPLIRFDTRGSYKGQTTSPSDLVASWGVSYSTMNSLGNLISAGDTVPTPILLKDTTKWLAKEASSDCGVVGRFGNNDDDTVEKLNACYLDYKNNDPDKLYNGFLVVQLGTNQNYQSSDILNGHFLIILKGSSSQRLPATKKDAVVMLYLPNGANDLLPNDPNEYYNYFFYSKGNISQFLSWGNRKISGSVILADGAKLGKSQGGSNFTYDADVLQALADADIIESNPEYSDKVLSGSSSVTSATEGTQDVYYIATSPRLRVQLESQYVNEESFSESNAEDLNPSIVIIPRIVYLQKNAKGSLNQYYSVINLNGATDNSSGSVTCDPSGLKHTGAVSGSSGGIYTCTYSPTNGSYNKCPFYVVVEGESDTKPKINFTTDFTELSTGEYATVSLNVAKGSGSISVYVRVTNDNSWTFNKTSKVTEVEGNLYEVNVNANNTDQSVPLFTNITGSVGSIIFELVGPAVGATIWDPKMTVVTIKGSMNVTRAGLEQYLNDNPSASDADSVSKWKSYPDCGSYTPDLWISPNQACHTTTANDSWVCALTNVALESSVNINACNVYIPQDNRTIETPEADQSYVLYGAIKRKPLSLNVKSVGASSRIVLKDSSSVTKDEFTLNSNESSNFQVFYGEKVKVFASAQSSSDEFSYWKCKKASGEACDIPSFGGSTYTINPTSDNDTLFAYFNQRDNCFTESFTDLQADCNYNEKIRCIDKCASGTNCPVTAGTYPNTADWTMVYANKSGSFVKPIIHNVLSNLDNASQKAYVGSANNPVFVLKSVPAGYNGEYSAQIRNYPKSSVLSAQALNTGLVFRSNASGTSYFSLSLLSEKSGKSNLLRVCYATDVIISGTTNCITKGDALASWSGSNLDNVETYTMKAVLNGSSLIVSVLDGDGQLYIPETNFDLSSLSTPGLSEELNEYVGFKLYGDNFRFYSLSWSSDTYMCADEASIYCSVKANYAGGRIPSNTNITPWAYVTNYCEDEDACCTYHFIPSVLSFNDGFYSESTIKAWATCSQNGSTMVTDTVPCGSFRAGKQNSCKEHLSITSSKTCYLGNCSILLSLANLRDATLNMDATINGDDTISVYLINDILGLVKSLVGGYITSTGSYSFPISDFIDAEFFNPEAVTAIVFSSAKGNSFEIKNLVASCSKALQLSSCNVSYDGTDLNFSAFVANASSCSISGTNVSENGLTCNNSWNYNVTTDLSSYGDQTIPYTITAYNADNSKTETCSGSVTIQTVSGSCSWSPSTLTASVTGASQFSASFTNCPASGCNYVIKDNNGTQVSSGTGTLGTATFNTPASTGDYTYSAIVNGNTICSATLTVKAGTPPTVSCGSLNNNGTYTASVSDPDQVGWTYQVIVTDNVGLPLHTSALSATTTESGSITYTYTPSFAGKYFYSLKVNEVVYCSDTLSIDGAITSCSLSSTNINDGDYVTFTANTNKIADGTSCVIKHSDGTNYTSGSPSISSNQCSSTFYPTKSGVYSVYIGEQSKSCGTITVNSVVESSSSGGGTCDYTSSLCNGMYASAGDVPTPSSTTFGQSSVNLCYFLTNITLVEQPTTINGVDVSCGRLDWNQPSCATALPSKKDGGYYVYVVSYGYDVTGTGGTSPNCGGTVSSSSSVASSSSVVESSSSAGGVQYVWDSDMTVGVTYAVTCTDPNQAISCVHNHSSGADMEVNGSVVWNNFSGNQQVLSKCVNGTTIKVTRKSTSVLCKNRDSYY